MKIYQKGFNYSQDGPGNRLVYHLQGCNFKCKWCSNPESMDFVGSSMVVSVDDMVAEAISCKPMFFDGGGVTLTGGEPTVQFHEVKELLEKLSAAGINTAMETNGSHPQLTELDVDFLIMDFKHFDEERHKLWTCFSNQITLDNFSKMAESGRQLLVRIPVINGVNAEPQGFVQCFKKYDCTNIKFEFLAYHEFGKNKWKEKYEIENGYVTQKIMADFKNTFNDNGLNVVRT